MVVSGALAMLGILAAYLLYIDQPWIAGLIRATMPKTYQTLWNKYFVDEAYDKALVSPARQAGRVCVGLDDFFIDGLLWIVTAIPRGLAYLLRTMQGGFLQGYGLSMAAGIAVIVVLVLAAD